MRLGDIKAEALKLMFADYDTDIIAENIPDLEGQEDLRSYLINMNGSINRCFSDLESKRVLPVKTRQLEASEGIAGAFSVRFDLDALISDFSDIARVVYENVGEYCGEMAYRREGNTLILDGFDFDGEYRLLYYPRIPRVSQATGELTELPIPDEIAAFIPYFVKGELYREDEINDAAEARNWYEAAMEQIVTARSGRQTRVRTVYSQTEGGVL